MAYLRVECSVARNKKFVKAGPAPSWLWICGLAYCQEGLTDGFIPREALPYLGVKNAAQLASHLVIAGLWDVADGGWHVHDYLEHNRSSSEVAQIKGDRRAAGRSGGLASSDRRKQVAEANKNPVEATVEANEKHVEPRSDQLSSDQLRSAQKQKSSAEPLRDSTPVALSYPVVGDPEHPEWALHHSRVVSWQAAYPNLDVLSECRKAEVWTRANPNRRKTAKGMPAFLVTWLNRQTNHPAQPSSGGASTAKPLPKWYQDVQARKAAAQS